MKYIKLILPIWFSSCYINSNLKNNELPCKLHLETTVEIEFIKFNNYVCINNTFIYINNTNGTDLPSSKFILLPSRYYNYKILKANPSFEYYVGTANKYYYSDSVYAFDLFNLKEVGFNKQRNKITVNSNSFYEKKSNDTSLFLVFTIEANFIYYPTLSNMNWGDKQIRDEIPCSYYSALDEYGYMVLDSVLSSTTLISNSKISKTLLSSDISTATIPIIY